MDCTVFLLSLTCLLLTVLAETLSNYNVYHIPNHRHDNADTAYFVEYEKGAFPRSRRDVTQNDTNYIVEEIHHTYYIASYYGPEHNGLADYWVDMDDGDTQELLSSRHRTGVIHPLTFTFPFYGHDVNSVVIATGGFIYVGSYIHQWLAATQYISPLMANFDPSHSDQSTVRIRDDGEMFTVEWHNVVLADHIDAGNFTFQSSIYRDGRIIFGYKNIAKPVVNISDGSHPVKVGLADAYYHDQPIGRGFIRRVIYEYHSIGLEVTGIQSGSVILLQPQPTCTGLSSCEECTGSQIGFNCSWCETTQKCSSGFDRHRQEWVANNCEENGVEWLHHCPVTTTLMPTTTTVQTTLPPSSDDTVMIQGDDPCLSNPCFRGSCISGNHGNYICDCDAGYNGHTCAININECASNPCFNDAKCTDGVNKYYCDCTPGYEGARCNKLIEMDFCAQLTPCMNGGTCINYVDTYHCKCTSSWYGATCMKRDTSNDTPRGEPVKQVQDDTSKSGSGSGSGAAIGGVLGVLITIVIIVVVIGWLIYAYRFPTTKSGLLLIEMRKCQCMRRRDHEDLYHVSLDKVVMESEA